MKTCCSLVFLVILVQEAYCGVVGKNGETQQELDVIEENEADITECGLDNIADGKESPNSPLLYDTNIDNHPSSNGVKHKRCHHSYSRVGASLEPRAGIVGAKAPHVVERRDRQNKFYTKACSTCMGHCDDFSNCPVCEKLCSKAAGNDEPNEVNTNNVVGAPQEIPSQEPVMSVRSNFDDDKRKNVYTITTLKTGYIKELIMKVLGVSKPEDIDTVVIWVTTHSNNPPFISSYFNGELDLEGEKAAEALKKEMESHMQNLHQDGKKFMKEGEKGMDNAIRNILSEVHPKILGSKGVDNAEMDSPRSNKASEMLPRYPIESEPLIVPQLMNPGIIEGPPNFRTIDGESEDVDLLEAGHNRIEEGSIAQFTDRTVEEGSMAQFTDRTVSLQNPSSDENRAEEGSIEQFTDRTVSLPNPSSDEDQDAEHKKTQPPDFLLRAGNQPEVESFPLDSRPRPFADNQRLETPFRSLGDNEATGSTNLGTPLEKSVNEKFETLKKNSGIERTKDQMAPGARLREFIDNMKAKNALQMTKPGDLESANDGLNTVGRTHHNIGKGHGNRGHHILHPHNHRSSSQDDNIGMIYKPKEKIETTTNAPDPGPLIEKLPLPIPTKPTSGFKMMYPISYGGMFIPPMPTHMLQKFAEQKKDDTVESKIDTQLGIGLEEHADSDNQDARSSKTSHIKGHHQVHGKGYHKGHSQMSHQGHGQVHHPRPVHGHMEGHMHFHRSSELGNPEVLNLSEERTVEGNPEFEREMLAEPARDGQFDSENNPVQTNSVSQSESLKEGQVVPVKFNVGARANELIQKLKERQEMRKASSTLQSSSPSGASRSDLGGFARTAEGAVEPSVDSETTTNAPIPTKPTTSGYRGPWFLPLPRGTSYFEREMLDEPARGGQFDSENNTVQTNSVSQSESLKEGQVVPVKFNVSARANELIHKLKDRQEMRKTSSTLQRSSPSGASRSDLGGFARTAEGAVEQSVDSETTTNAPIPTKPTTSGYRGPWFLPLPRGTSYFEREMLDEPARGGQFDSENNTVQTNSVSQSESLKEGQVVPVKFNVSARANELIHKLKDRQEMRKTSSTLQRSSPSGASRSDLGGFARTAEGAVEPSVDSGTEDSQAVGAQEPFRNPDINKFEIAEAALGAVRDLSKNLQEITDAGKTSLAKIKTDEVATKHVTDYAQQTVNTIKDDSKNPNVGMNTPEMLGSQPLENSLERIQPSMSLSGRPWRNQNSANKALINEPINELVETPSLGSANQNLNGVAELEMVGESNPDMNTRGQFEGEQHSYSNSMGAIVPAESPDDSYHKKSSDVYFLGNGIKLPIIMAKGDDGVLHLSVDLDKLCSCNNITCPKNHTVLEKAVETILENEADGLKEQLEPMELVSKSIDPSNMDYGDMPLGMASPQGTFGDYPSDLEERFEMQPRMGAFEDDAVEDGKEEQMALPHRNQRDTDEESRFFDRKNKVTDDFNSMELLSDNNEVLEKSIEAKAVKSDTKSLHVPMKKLAVTSTHNPHEPGYIQRQQNLLSKTMKVNDAAHVSGGTNEKDTKTALLSESTTKTREGITKVSSSEPNYLQNFVNNRLDDIRSKLEIGNEDMKKELSFPEYFFKNLWAAGKEQVDKIASNLNANNPSPTLGSRLGSLFGQTAAGNNELYENLAPITKPYKFKALENQLKSNLEHIGDTVDNYTKRDDEILKEEVAALDKITKNPVVKKEVGIVSNILKFLKDLAADKNKRK